MKKYGSFIFLTLMLWGISIGFIISDIQNMRIIKQGIIVDVIVEKLQPFCLAKHNRIWVSYEGKSYTLRIGSVSCRKGYYHVGQVFQCYWDQKRQKLHHMGLTYGSMTIFAIVVFLAPIVMWYKYRNTEELPPEPRLIKRGRNEPKSEFDKRLKKKK